MSRAGRFLLPEVRLRFFRATRCRLPALGLGLALLWFLPSRVSLVRADEVREGSQAVTPVEESFAESAARPPANRVSYMASIQRGNPVTPPLFIPVPGSLATADVENVKDLTTTRSKDIRASSAISGYTTAAFNGPSQGVDFITPPDPIIAAGPNHLVACVNTQISVYSKAGNRLFSQTWEQFFGGVPDFDAVDIIADPKVFYDVASGRFFVMILGLQSSGQGGAQISGSRYLIAVTNTNDPTGVWRKFSSESTSSGNWSDYPGFGVDQNSVYVTANFFTTNGQIAGVNLRVYNKAQFTAFGGVTTLTFTDTTNVTDRDGSGAISAFTIQPAVALDSGVQREWLVSARFDPTVLAGGTGERNVTLYSIDGLNSPRALRKFTVPVTQAYSFSSFAEQPADASGTVFVLDTLDTRLLNAILIGNRLWTTHAVGTSTSDQAVVRWYEFDVSDPNRPRLFQSGTISRSNAACFNPAVCANSAGNAVVTFTRSSRTEFASMNYTPLLRGDLTGPSAPPASPGDQVQIKAGGASYLGFRWGDFAGASLDPLDRASIWIMNETAPTEITWATSIARVTLPGAGGGVIPTPEICPPALTLLTPNGGEAWPKLTEQTISWTGAEQAGADAFVNLLLVRFDQTLQDEVIVGAIRNANSGDELFPASQGAFAWSVGNDLRDATNPNLPVNIDQVTPSGDFADYRVIVQSAAINCAGGTGTDGRIVSGSTNYFRISAPLTVTARAARDDLFDSGNPDTPIQIGRGDSIQLAAAIPTNAGKPPFTFHWMPADSLDNPNSQRPIATPRSGKGGASCDPDPLVQCVSYTVQVTDSNGPIPQTATDSIVVKISDHLSADAGPNKEFVLGNPIVLEGRASGGFSPYTYVWSPIPDPAHPETANQAQPLAKPTQDTTYSLTVSDRVGNISGPDTVQAKRVFVLTVSNEPVNGGQITRDLVKAFYLPGDQIQFLATPASGFTFLRWEIGPPGSPNPSTPSDNPTLVLMPANDLNVRAVYQPSSGGTARPNTGTGGTGGTGGLLPVGCGTGLLESSGLMSILGAATLFSRRRRAL